LGQFHNRKKEFKLWLKKELSKKEFKKKKFKKARQQNKQDSELKR